MSDPGFPDARHDVRISDGADSIEERPPVRHLRVLGRVQRALEGLYRVAAPGEVQHFVISEAERSSLGVERAPREQLLLVHDPRERTLDVGLFVDEETLKRLAQLADRGALAECLNDFLMAVEGVSHFLYVMLRAQAERPFSGLELELQAEVDKYLLLLLGTWRAGGDPPTDLRQRLYRDVQLHDDLSPEERDRYRTANAAADEYTARLEHRYIKRRRIDDLLREVRRFYRMSCTAKLDHITREAA